MEYNVTFIHPTTNAQLQANINPELTADEVIAALVEENFIPAPTDDFVYSLSINGGQKVQGSQTLASGGLKDGGYVSVFGTGIAG